MADFVGDRERKIVHKNEPVAERCVEVNNIRPQNRVYFTALSQAHQQGYRDCSLCISGTTG